MTLAEKLYRRRLLLCVLLALMLRLGNVLSMEQPHSDDVSYINIAKSIVGGEGFRDANVYAYRYPAYVILLAGVFEVSGVRQAPMIVLQSLMGAATVLLFGLIVRRRLGDTASVFAAVVLAVYIPFVRLPGRLYTENLWFLLFVGVWWVLERPGSKVTIRDAVVAGVLSGLAVLTREVFLPMLVVYLILRLAIGGPAGRQWVPLTLVFVVACLVIAPWTVRNYLVLHRFVPVTTNNWANIYMGNYPQADGAYPETNPPPYLWHPPPSVHPITGLLEVDVAEGHRQLVLEFWRQHPGQTLQMALVKLERFWRLPNTLEMVVANQTARAAAAAWSGMFVVVFALTVYGLMRGAPRFRDNLWAYVLLIVPCLGCLLTYVIARYRFPTEFVLIFFAANGYIALLSTKNGQAAEPNPA